MTARQEKFAELFEAALVIPVLTIERLEDAVPLARALVAGGVRVLEVTLRTPVAIEAESQTTTICWSLTGEKREVDISGSGSSAQQGVPIAWSLLAMKVAIRMSTRNKGGEEKGT